MAAPGASAQEAFAPGPPTKKTAWVARVVAPAKALRLPGEGKVIAHVSPRARWNGGPVRLLVMRAGVGPDGDRWLKVKLQKRPNGTAGWIPENRVRLGKTHWRVEVSLRKRTAVLMRNGRRKAKAKIVVGAKGTPTPRGLFAIAERVRQPDPNEFLGTWALHLTGFSQVLDDYGGGPGTLALHGRGGAALLDPVGSAASHGCMRMNNGLINKFARHAAEGTPVLVKR